MLNRQGIKKIGLACLSSILATVLMLICLELVLQMNSDVDVIGHLPIYETDEELSYRIKPNVDLIFKSEEARVHIKTNSLGFRDNEWELTSEKNKILVLGDSFSFANQVDQDRVYTELWQKEIDVPVINTGVCAYSPVHEYQMLKRLNQRHKGLKINAVVQQFFIGNDLIINKIRPEPTTNGVLGMTKKRSLGTWLKRNSLLLRELARFAFVNENIQKILIGSGLLKNTIVDGGVGQLKIFHKEYWSTPDGQKHFDFLKKVFQDIKDEVDSHNQKLLLLIIPTKYQLSGKDFKWAMASYEGLMMNKGFESSKADRHYPNEILKKILEELDIKYVDCLSSFSEVKKNEGIDLYFKRDPHMNENGHRLVADILIRESIFFQNRLQSYPRNAHLPL